MSNFSNSDHHHVSNAESHQHPQHNAFFNNNAFTGLDGYLNEGPQNGSFDQSWAFAPDQYNVSGNSGVGWPDNAPQQHLQQPSTFRPGARPDQVFSSSSFANNLQGNTGNVNLGGNPSNFAGYPQPQYNSSTITPSNLTSQFGNPAQGLPTRQANNAFDGNGSTISPDALQSRPLVSAPSVNNVGPGLGQNVQTPGLPPKAWSPPGNLPKGSAAGNFIVLSTDRLRSTIGSRALSAFLDVGQEPFEYPISKSTIPIYYPRKSRNEIKRLLASDNRLKAKVNKKLSKKSGLTGTQSIPAQLDSTGKLTTQTSRRGSETSTEVTSSDESEYESSEDESKGPPIPTTRPTKPRDATRYDTIKSLWRPESRPVSAQDIRDGLKEFHDILSTIKDRWKSDNNAVKQAEETKKVNEIPLLKERVKSQLVMLEAALKAAAEFGHPDILDHFGASLAGVGSIAVFLQDRAKEQDYSSGLVIAILQFLSKCRMLDSGTLEKSAVGKLLPRFSKRGDDKVKALAKRIENNAIATTKKKKDAPKTLARSSSADKDFKSDNGPKSPQSTAGTKRGRSAESSAGDQPAKKVAGKPGDTSTVKKPASSGTTPANKTSGPTVTKSSSFISSLQSAKRPVAKPAAAPASQAKPAAPTKPATDTKSNDTSPGGFSFASVLADAARLKDDRPKESKSNDSRLSETPEQRAKRLRRESRRNLRVSFKAEDALVEVRFFEHDPDEELGHDASQMRDLNDVGSEGKMFKLHQQNHDMMDIDDDEETERGAVEQAWRTWIPLQEIEVEDVSAVAENYKPYGPLDPQCPERDVQQEREASTLVAVYTDPSDIPSSPNEPGSGSEGMAVDVKNFGATDAIHGRIEEVKKVQTRAPEQPAIPTPDISAILSALNQGGAAATNMSQSFNQSPANLASLIGSIPNMGAQQPPVAAPMLPSQQLSQHPPPPPPADMSAILAGLNANQIQPQPQPSNPPNGQPPVDVASLLATLTGNSQQPVPPPPPPMQPPFPTMPGMPQMSNVNLQDPMWQAAPQYASSEMPNMWQQQPQYQDQNSGGAVYENEARKRWREQNDDDDDENGAYKRQKNAAKKTPNPKSFFTQTCKYYKEGRCMKGSQCTYRHDDA